MVVLSRDERADGQERVLEIIGLLVDGKVAVRAADDKAFVRDLESVDVLVVVVVPSAAVPAKEINGLTHFGRSGLVELQHEDVALFRHGDEKVGRAEVVRIAARAFSAFGPRMVNKVFGLFTLLRQQCRAL